MTSLRYLIQFIGPLFLVYVLISLINMSKNDTTYDFKKLFKNKPILYSMLGMLVAIIGFLINQVVISRFYRFSFSGTFRFGTFGDISFGQWFAGILNFFGWRNDISVLSPSGIINIFLITALVLFILCSIDFINSSNNSETSRYAVIFALVSMGINIFATVSFCDFKVYYFVGPLMWIIPCIALFLESTAIISLKRYMCILLFSISVLTSSFVTYSEIQLIDANAEIREVAEFVENSGYTLGFDSRDPGAILTYITNGKVDMGLVDYENRKFLTSSRFWNDNFKQNEPIALIVSKEDFDDYPELNGLENCKKVYSNALYTVFDFKNKQVLKDELNKEKFKSYLDQRNRDDL